LRINVRVELGRPRNPLQNDVIHGARTTPKLNAGNARGNGYVVSAVDGLNSVHRVFCLSIVVMLAEQLFDPHKLSS
jgi:hypothetical protein